MSGKVTQTYTVKWGIRLSQQGGGCWEGAKKLLVKGLYHLLICFKALRGLAVPGETTAYQESFTDI